MKTKMTEEQQFVERVRLRMGIRRVGRLSVILADPAKVNAKLIELQLALTALEG